MHAERSPALLEEHRRADLVGVRFSSRIRDDWLDFEVCSTRACGSLKTRAGPTCGTGRSGYEAAFEHGSSS